MKKFFGYIILPIFRPRKQLEELIADEKQVKYGSLILLTVGILYTITVAIAAFKGIHIAIKPFVPIPESDYYFWEIFFTIPFFFIAVITFAGIVRFISYLLGGNGRFESIFSIYSIVTVLPLIVTMWIPETILILLKDPTSNIHTVTFPVVIDLSRQVMGVIWPLIYAVIGIKNEEKITWFQSILVTLIAFIPYTILVLTYIR